MKRGLALIVVIGILGVLAVLAAAFVMMAQLERRASEQRVNAARAYLLARSGIEGALARLDLGQDPAYGGENWDGDPLGLLSTYEADQETYHRTGVGTPADIDACPARHALRPSFFVRATGNPAVVPVDGRERGYSGSLFGDYAPKGNTYALKVQSSNAGIYINGGALDTQDRDPDGPGAEPEDFPLNPGAAAEVAPLLPNQVPDHKDTSMEGPNGFLVRLLNNLDAVVTNGASANLGEEIVGARPVGGYKSLDDLKPILSQPFVQNPSLVQQVQNLITPPAGMTRYEKFKPYLTLHAWVDPKVVKPQPMDGRPQRWEDIDDAHRVGTEAEEISGVHADPTLFTISGTTYYWLTVTSDTSAPRLTLNPGITGNGKEALGTDGPWTQTITATNPWEGSKTYPVSWERNFVYAWSQLRPAPIALEPRSPVSLHAAPEEVLASVFLGLKGTYLEVWEGASGWEGGFGWYAGTFGYPYPSQATEETPWIRTRVDYGMTYGASTGSPPARPWYGPADYDPHRARGSYDGGSSLIQAAPLGRLKETNPITPAQALSGAHQARQAMSELGPARISTWAQVNAFIDALPRWEDVNEDSLLDGPPYPVFGNAYVRRMYLREDANNDFILQRETFTPLPGTSWKGGNIAWLDPHVGKAQLPQGSAVIGPAGLGALVLVPGLTFLQKDAIKAMINPNTDLNDFNPDANLWKEVDKVDLAGIRPDPLHGGNYVHTTELSLEDGAGVAKVQALGRVLSSSGRLLAQRQLGATVSLGDIYRDTTQADFMRDYHVSDEALRAEASAREEYEEYKAERKKAQDEERPQKRAEYKAQRKDYWKSQGYDEQRAEDYAERDAKNWESADKDQQDRSDKEEDAKAEAGRQAWRKALRDIFRGPPSLYPLSGDQPLLSYPELQTTAGGAKGAGADYDGQISLGFISISPSPPSLPSANDLLRGDLFNTADADTGQKAAPDLRGSSQGPLLAPAGRDTGNVFPDGVYSEKDRSLKFPPLSQIRLDWPFIECWAKPAWFPEASPRAHALVSVSRGGNAWSHPVPLEDVGAFPTGLYFVPARNNFWQSTSGVYLHCPTYGLNWPSRSLLWGKPHHFWITDAVNRRGILEAPPGTHPLGRLEAHRWVHLAMRGPLNQSGNGWQPWGVRWYSSHSDGTENHVRFGEIASGNNMNYAADATFANVRVARTAPYSISASLGGSGVSPYDIRATPGRYYKEGGATYTAPKLPTGLHPRRVTWTEIPCMLWFDTNGDGWLGDPSVLGAHQDTGNVWGVGVHGDVAVGSVGPLNDQFGSGGALGPNGLRDVHIALELWDDLGTADPKDDVRLARFDNPAADNRIPRPWGRLYYKAVFVNEWDAATRANHPLDVTPFLDDVTLTYMEAGGPRIVHYEADVAE